MKNSKLLSLLSSFSKQEWNQFLLFIQSPFFNKNERILKLYEFLSPFYPIFPEEKISNEKIHSHIFGKSEFKDVAIRKLLSEFSDLADQFIAQLSIQNDPIYFQLKVLTQYNFRNLPKWIEDKSTEIEKLLSTQQAKSQNHYYRYFLYNILSNRVLKYKEKNNSRYLNELGDALDHFFVSAKMDEYVLKLTQSQIYHEDYLYTFQEQVLEYTQHILQNQIDPLLKSNLLNYKIISNTSDVNAFNELSELIFKDYKNFSIPNLYNSLALLENFCSLHINNGDLNYTKKLLDIYKFRAENSLLSIEGNEINPIFFTNCVSIALSNNETEWAEQFINTYQNKLNEEIRNDISGISKAKILFYKKEYDKVISTINRVEFFDIMYQLIARRMIIKSYFHLQEFDAMDSAINAFKLFLFRKKSSIKQNFETNNNFILALEKILTLKPGDEKKGDKLSTDINSNKSYAEKNWLLKELELKMRL